MGDTKPANILLLMDENSAKKYHLLLTDLGGACDKTTQHLNKYPRLYTRPYFSKKLIDKRILKNEEFTDREII